MNSKIASAKSLLEQQGHSVRPYPERPGWYEIDSCMLAKTGELEELADGVYTLEELEELMVKRHFEERGVL